MKKQLSGLCLLLAAVMAFPACGSGSSSAPETTASAPADTAAATTAAPETTLSAEELRLAVPDDLPDKKFDGRKFTVISETYDKENQLVDELKGETYNDALFERNSRISERFDVKIGGVFYDKYQTTRSTIEQAVTSGDTTSFNLIAEHMVASGGNAIAGYYLNWYDVPHINFEKPWWAPSTREDLTMNKKAFLAVGDYLTILIRRTWVYLYNKELWKELKLEDPYTIVNQGKWTIDKVEEIADTTYADLNGNGTVDLGDRFGFVSYNNAPDYYLWAFDNPIVRKDKDGKAVLSMYSQHYTDVMQKIISFHLKKNIFVSEKSSQAEVALAHFNQAFDVGKAVLTTAQFGRVKSAVVDFTIGVLPFPKFNEAQESYHGSVDGSGAALSVAVNAKDLDFVGTITEALCAESYKTVVPALYEVVFKTRYADLKEDAEMMDLIMNTRMFDIGYMYDNWLGASFWPEYMLNGGISDVASYYASNWPAAEKHYETVIKLFNG